MSDYKVIHDLYLELKNLGENEYLELISKLTDKNEIEFFVKVMDTILQQRKRSSIK